MKFDVKFWLFYSALIGFFPGFIVFCISLVMLELPAPLAFLIGIAVALAIGFAMQMSNISKEKKVEAARMVNRPLSSRQMKKEKLRHEGLVPVSKGSQAL